MNAKIEEWIRTYRKFERITDSAGCRIDKGILECVVALNLLGYETELSCFGHVVIDDSGNETRRESPYVSFCAANREDITAAKMKYRLIENILHELQYKENDHIDLSLEEAAELKKLQTERDEMGKPIMDLADSLRLKLSDLLNEFYHTHQGLYKSLLIVIPSGAWNKIMNLYDFCDFGDSNEPSDVALVTLQQHQAEWNAFTEFLKARFFAE